jgi:hypothetical protein
MNTTKSFQNEDRILRINQQAAGLNTQFYVLQNTEHKRMVKNQELHYPYFIQ